MCYVIVTCRSLGWTLLSVTVTLATVAAVTSPHWLIGTPRETTIQLINSSENFMDSETFRPTVGLFNRCTKLQLNFQIAKVRDNCATFVVEFMAEDDYFPHAWKACVILFAIAGTFLIFAMLCSVMSLFVRSICGKSIFNVAGFIQSIGGMNELKFRVKKNAIYTRNCILLWSNTIDLKIRFVHIFFSNEFNEIHF